jgi:hypothetical protein
MESQFINNDEAMNSEKIDCEFAHFNSIELCNDFVIYMTNNGYKITHKCCDGNGCGIKKIKRIELKIIVNKYLQKKETNTYNTYNTDNTDNTYNTYNTYNTDKFHCDICYEDVDNLITKCKICTHPFCPDCWNKITKDVCPYCRSIF